MRRREFLIHVAGVCACTVPLARGYFQDADGWGGCALAAASGVGSASTTRSSGNAQLDRALIAEVKKVDRVFGINPGYRFLRDGARLNAYATSETMVRGTSGTIFFGLTLLSRELAT